VITISSTEYLDTERKLELELRSFRQAARESESIQQPFKGKRCHRSSSDSSLLEPVAKPEPKLREEEEPKRRHIERRDKPKEEQSAKRKAPELSTSSSASSNVRQETFEERGRHKTREDHYEPTKKKHKANKRDMPDVERKSRKKREKRGDRKKESKKAAENLMSHFSSKSVGQERLTVSTSRH
jgi:hypothetical protein